MVRTHTYATPLALSFSHKYTHCSRRFSPSVPLKNPYGLSRTPSRPAPMAAQSLSTVSSVNAHRFSRVPPYASERVLMFEW